MHLRNAALLILLFGPRPILAQEIVVRGRVLDWKGGALADASVRLTVGDKVVVETRWGADGEFALKLGAPGEFTIKADASNLKTVAGLVLCDLKPQKVGESHREQSGRPTRSEPCPLLASAPTCSE